MKYSKDFKLKVVRSISSGEHTIRSAEKHFVVSRRNIRTWYCRYERYGERGISLSGGRYSGEFKEKVVLDMNENHLSLSQTAVKYGIPTDSTVLIWDRIYRSEGKDGLYRNNRGKMKKPKQPKKYKAAQTVEEELRRENELLKAEVSYLKKLRALVEERVLRESGRAPKPSKD